MGLDMYLEGTVYIGGAYHNIKEDGLTVSKEFNVSKEDDNFDKADVFPTEGIDEIVYRVGYWRKANQIHKWFVDNVQSGVDDCSKYRVSKDKLFELKGICEDLLSTKDKEKALEVLPPQEGFFFGQTNPESETFWEWYWDDIAETVKNVSKALRYIEKYDAEITYRASW